MTLNIVCTLVSC